MRSCVWAGHYDTVTICNTPNCISSSRITVVQYELHNKIIFKARLYQNFHIVSFSSFGLLQVLLATADSRSVDRAELVVLFTAARCATPPLTFYFTYNFSSLVSLIFHFLSNQYEPFVFRVMT